MTETMPPQEQRRQPGIESKMHPRPSTNLASKAPAGWKARWR